PEQIQGKELNTHSDMYSLGVVLYELLTGRRPFLAENIESLLKKILELEPLPPTETRPELPKELDTLVLRAMKKTPDQRYATWAEFALEISKAGQSLMPPGSIPDSEKYVALKRVPMLSTLADSELWELARAGKWGRVPKGRPIVKENEKGTSFFFLAQGE